MLRTALTAALLTLAMNASAVELTNDTPRSDCGTVTCRLAEAGIDFMGGVTYSNGVQYWEILLLDDSRQVEVCNLTDDLALPVFFIVGDYLEEC